jgi:hypothetical protein
MDPNAHAELMLLFEQATEDIRTFQERQTSVTNLTILVYAGLIGFASIVASHSGSILWLLRISATVTAFFSIWWLVNLQSAMNRARGKVRRAMSMFGKEFHNAHGPDLRARRVERMDTIPFLIGVVITGLLLSGFGFNVPPR